MVYKPNKFSQGWGSILRSGDHSMNKYTKPTQKAKTQKICAYCQQPFLPPHGKQKTCSERCKKEYLREYQKQKYRENKPTVYTSEKGYASGWKQYSQGGKFRIWMMQIPQGTFRITVDYTQKHIGYPYNFIFGDDQKGTVALENGILPKGADVDYEVQLMKNRAKTYTKKIQGG